MWRIIFGLWWAMDDNKVFILFPVASYSYPRPTSVSELLACFLATREERLQAEWVPRWMYNGDQFSRKSLLQPRWVDQTFSSAIWGAARGWGRDCLCLEQSFPLLSEAGQLPIWSCKSLTIIAAALVHVCSCYLFAWRLGSLFWLLLALHGPEEVKWFLLFLLYSVRIHCMCAKLLKTIWLPSVSGGGSGLLIATRWKNKRKDPKWHSAS